MEKNMNRKSNPFSPKGKEHKMTTKTEKTGRVTMTPTTINAGELSEADLAAIVGGENSQTAGGGNTSIWGKIKSVVFGVDPNFYD